MELEMTTYRKRKGEDYEEIPDGDIVAIHFKTPFGYFEATCTLEGFCLKSLTGKLFYRIDIKNDEIYLSNKQRNIQWIGVDET